MLVREGITDCLFSNVAANPSCRTILFSYIIYILWRVALSRTLILNPMFGLRVPRVRQMYVDGVDSISHVVTLYKCRPEADICINALLAQLSCVQGVAPRSDRPPC